MYINTCICIFETSTHIIRRLPDSRRWHRAPKVTRATTEGRQLFHHAGDEENQSVQGRSSDTRHGHMGDSDSDSDKVPCAGRGCHESHAHVQNGAVIMSAVMRHECDNESRSTTLVVANMLRIDESDARVQNSAPDIGENDDGSDDELDLDSMNLLLLGEPRVCMYVCMYVCICMCVCMCVYVCMYVCICMYVYVCMYVSGPAMTEKTDEALSIFLRAAKMNVYYKHTQYIYIYIYIYICTVLYCTVHIHTCHLCILHTTRRFRALPCHVTGTAHTNPDTRLLHLGITNPDPRLRRLPPASKYLRSR